MAKFVVVSAFAAAVSLALVMSILQALTTEPLIFTAEQYEVSGDGAGHAHDTDAPADHPHDGAPPRAWSPADGVERAALSLVGNGIVAFGAALLLLGGMVFAGPHVNAISGFHWGLAGFVAVTLLPSLGLPPELPATPAAGLAERQIWWLLTVVASMGGLALILLLRNAVAIAAGLALLALPHIVGAPVAPSHAVPYPGALSGAFVAASIFTGAVLWCGTGAVAGFVFRRLEGGRGVTG
ncbi:MAG: CbtA family protein [Alphaproteobacteria bacterium]